MRGVLKIGECCRVESVKLRVQLEVSHEFLRSTRRRMEREGVASEVVIVAARPGGKVLLHTKAFYPPNGFRLPSGKMRAGEDPDDAFAREFREELGREGRIARKLGVVVCTLTAEDDSLDVVSHVYLSEESSAPPVPADEDEQITEFVEIPVSELPAVAERLRNLPDRWRDWGRMRAVVHDFAAEQLSGIPPA